MAEFDHGDEIPSLDPVAHRTGAPNEDGEIAPLPRDSERAQQRERGAYADNEGVVGGGEIAPLPTRAQQRDHTPSQVRGFRSEEHTSEFQSH